MTPRLISYAPDDWSTERESFQQVNDMNRPERGAEIVAVVGAAVFVGGYLWAD